MDFLGNKIEGDNLSDGGTINGDLEVVGDQKIDGDLDVTGTVTASTIIAVDEIKVSDAIIQMAAGNPGDALNMGILEEFNAGGVKYSGLMRDRVTKQQYLLEGVTPEPNTMTDLTTLQRGDLNVSAITIGASGIDYTLPSARGTIGQVLVADSGGATVSWVSRDLQTSYNTSTLPQIITTPSNQTLQIKQRGAAGADETFFQLIDSASSNVLDVSDTSIDIGVDVDMSNTGQLLTGINSQKSLHMIQSVGNVTKWKIVNDQTNDDLVITDENDNNILVIDYTDKTIDIAEKTSPGLGDVMFKIRNDTNTIRYFEVNNVHVECDIPLDMNSQNILRPLTVEAESGTNAAPSFTFWGDQDTGMYHPAANEIGFSTNGVKRMEINDTEVLVTEDFSLDGTTDNALHFKEGGVDSWSFVHEVANNSMNIEDQFNNIHMRFLQGAGVGSFGDLLIEPITGFRRTVNINSANATTGPLMTMQVDNATKWYIGANFSTENLIFGEKTNDNPILSLTQDGLGSGQVVIGNPNAGTEYKLPTSNTGASTGDFLSYNAGTKELSFASFDTSILKDRSTGVLSGGALSINVDDTKFDIQDGEGSIVNPANGNQTAVSWSGLTAQSTAYSGILTYVSINSSGNPIYQTSRPTNQQIRDQIFLGVLVHVNSTNIDTINNEQSVIVSGTNQLHDLAEAIGFINSSGNEISSSGTALRFKKDAGTVFAMGSNWVNNIKDPNNISTPLVDTNGAGIFQYRNRDGTSSALNLQNLIPGIYDDGSAYNGSTPSVTSNDWSIQRVYLFTSNNVKIQPGQDTYNTQTEALNGITTENFITEPSIKENGLLIGYIVVRGGATDLSDSGDAVFLQASKFGGTSGGGGGVSDPEYGEFQTTTQGAQYVNINDTTWRDLNNAMTAGSLSNFTHSAGVLTYTGDGPTIFNITASISMESNNFNGIPVDIGIFKNAAGTPEHFQAFTCYDATDTEDAVVNKLISLDTNDTLKLQWRRRDTTLSNPDFYINTVSMVVTQATGTGGGAGGDVVGPASAGDEALTRYDGTTGKLIQDSKTVLNDDGEIFTRDDMFTSSSWPSNGLKLGGVFDSFGTSVTVTNTTALTPVYTYGTPPNNMWKVGDVLHSKMYGRITNLNFASFQVGFRIHNNTAQTDFMSLPVQTDVPFVFELTSVFEAVGALGQIKHVIVFKCGASYNFINFKTTDAAIDTTNLAVPIRLSVQWGGVATASNSVTCYAGTMCLN
jgi:hypothetical protein